ncbi:MAG: RluA family pseudouridine synthase [Spirochaetaceae bacterium]|jgi:23S rRNA pseudouridine1911/1915/1917 synthase|nr:RluA family pseudouridine synthase [Spirochaetaceae bacterium]
MSAYHGIVDLPSAQTVRLDIYIAEYLGLMRRSQIKTRRLESAVNGKKVKRSRPVRAGDELCLSWEDTPPLDIVPQHIPLNVVYEDERVIVVNKRQGLVVHPGAGNLSGTLVNALMWRLGQKPGGGCAAAGPRPFIVHRLDKDTSGLLIAAWDTDALSFLAGQFRDRTVRKVYAAIVAGCPAERIGVISANIVRDRNDRKRFTVSKDSGRSALTHYKVVKSYGGRSLLRLRPKTGRTHQLRVHLRSIGHPIVGDPVYGQAHGQQATLALHAKSLELILPGADERTRFVTKLPARFKGLLGC